MERLTAKDFAPELLELYDGYAHGTINRREFLDRAALFTLGGLTASALLAALSPNYALAEQVKFTDPAIVADYITYPSPQGHGTVRGYLVRPANASGKLPAVVVVHADRGHLASRRSAATLGGLPEREVGSLRPVSTRDNRRDVASPHILRGRKVAAGEAGSRPVSCTR